MFIIQNWEHLKKLKTSITLYPIRKSKLKLIADLRGICIFGSTYYYFRYIDIDTYISRGDKMEVKGNIVPYNIHFITRKMD